jgi:hypothetical protein
MYQILYSMFGTGVKSSTVLYFSYLVCFFTFFTSHLHSQILNNASNFILQRINAGDYLLTWPGLLRLHLVTHFVTRVMLNSCK